MLNDIKQVRFNLDLHDSGLEMPNYWNAHSVNLYLHAGLGLSKLALGDDFLSDSSIPSGTKRKPHGPHQLGLRDF